MSRPRPEVVRQEVHWVPEDRLVPLPHGEVPYRIWTLFREEDPEKKPETPITPVHRENAFLEDYVHDWNERFNRTTKQLSIHYASRVVDSGVWILMEFVAPEHNRSFTGMR